MGVIILDRWVFSAHCSTKNRLVTMLQPFYSFQCFFYCFIETDNTDVSVNVTKPEETTTKGMEKHMDSIKSVIQDTMKTVHENIDNVQSNVDKVHTDVRSLELIKITSCDITRGEYNIPIR
jgi:esterase/lipase